MSDFTLNPELGTSVAGNTPVSNLDSGNVSLTLGSGTPSTTPSVGGIAEGDQRLDLNSNSNSLTLLQAEAWSAGAVSRSVLGGGSANTGLTRTPNNNSITVIPDLADINITSTVDRLADSTTFFAVVPGSGEPEAVISRREVEAAIQYRNAFKSGAPLTEYVNFFRSIQGSYFAGYGAQTFFGGQFSNDSIFFWIKKFFSLPELSKFIDATANYARQAWSTSTFNAIHLKFILKKYTADSTSFFQSFSDSLGLLANSKYHQLDSTQPIFDITQEGYGVPIPFTANMENKVGPTARNLMYNLSKGTTAQMRRNLLNLAYYNALNTDNFKVSSKVAHGCNLVNDIAFFVEFNQRITARANAVKGKFSAYSGKLFNFIQYISNIGNRCALNLRDIYAPINGYDKDFVKTPGSTDLAVDNLSQAAIDGQIQELNNFAVADATIARNLYANTVLANGDFSPDQFISRSITYYPDNTWSTDYPDINSIPSDQGGFGPVEPELPSDQFIIEEIDENGETVYRRGDNNQVLTDEEAARWVIAREQALAEGKDEFNASEIADRVFFGTSNNSSQISSDYLPPVIGPSNNSFPPSGGTNSSKLAQDRQAYFAAELNNPAVLGRLSYLAWQEVDRVGPPSNAQGTNVNQQTAFIETVVNRAFFSGKSLTDIINQEEYGFGPGVSTINPATQQAFLNVVTGGSNITNLATDNASNDYNRNNPVADNRINAGVTGGWFSSGQPTQPNQGEFFYRADAFEQGYGSTAGRNATIYAQTNGLQGAPSGPPVQSIQDLSISQGNAPRVDVERSTADAISLPPPSVDTISPVTRIPPVTYNNQEVTQTEQSRAVNAALDASARPYSNKQRMFPFSFRIRGEDYDGGVRNIDVDFLLKKIVMDNFNPYKRIATLAAGFRGAALTEEGFGTGGSLGGQTLQRYLNLLKGIDGRQLISSGNISAVAENLGINLSSGVNGQVFQQLKSIIDQNAITSRTLSQGLESFLQLGAERLPANLMSQITSSQAIYDGFIGQLNSLGVGSVLPTSFDIVGSLNPFNYIDINIQGVIPNVSLGSLGDIAGILSEIGTSGPPTSIGDAFALAKQIKNIICNFQLPIINWPIVQELLKVNWKDQDIGKAIKENFNKLVDRLGEVFNPAKIFEAIKENVVSYFKNLYRELFVCSEKDKINKTGTPPTGP